MNVLSGVVPINKVELNKFEKPLRKLADRRVEKSERIKFFRSDSRIRLIKLIALPCIAFLEQNAHGRVYANSSSNVCERTTSNCSISQQKNVREKGKQMSLLQRSKSPAAPSTTQQDTQQQTDNILENVKDELNETRDNKIDIKVSTEIRERVLRDIKHLDRKKIEKAILILEKIEESESLSLDQTSRLMVKKPDTGIFVADFPYDLQQTTSKLSLEHYNVLTFPDISSQLTSNTYAKNFLPYH